MKLSEVLFADSKKMWYGTKNAYNPAYDDWKSRYYSTADSLSDFMKNNPKPAQFVAKDLPASFNLGEFKRFGSYEEKFGYLAGTAMRLGAGSSRVVFAVSPKRVIKLAGGVALANAGERPEDLAGDRGNMRKAGEYQNRREFDTFNSSKGKPYHSLLPQVFEKAEDYSWLLCELVRELKSNEELAEMLGLSGLNELDAWRSIVRSGEIGNTAAPNLEKFLVARARRGADNAVLLQVVGLFSSDPDMNVRDTISIEQWGKGSDGRLVLLDSGADYEVIGKHYVR